MTITSFRQFISESKNLHMEHLEDSLFNEGSAGVQDAIRFAESVTKMLSGSSSSGVNVTVKWDGAPAIICGINPENNKFFVGTKSVFNAKTPKINYTNADIDSNHSGDLASKLKVALQYLSKLGIKGVIQGDLMFTAGDLGDADINGDKHITFTPNTITYAVPEGGPAAREIKAASIGIIFHTEYTGKDMSSMKASFNPRIRSLKKISKVWYDDATFRDVHGKATFTKTDTGDMKKLITKVNQLFNSNKEFIDDLIRHKSIIGEVKIYGNSNIRNGISNMSAEEFIKYINDKMQKAIDALKTEKAKNRKELVRKQTIGYLSKNSKKLNSIFNLHSALTEMKMKLLQQLQKVKSIGTFIRTNDGFEVTAPEGFVAIDDTGKALKLVDRLVFSKHNFTVSKNWDTG
ncbi:MAG: hypothetical protein H8D80_00155 [Proteobacteria bacterium]|nr:hypothetical protein [Pseudomonadota bacterium]